MSQRDYSNLPVDGDSGLTEAMLGVGVVLLLVAVVVVEYYLNADYGVNFWNF